MGAESVFCGKTNMVQHIFQREAIKSHFGTFLRLLPAQIMILIIRLVKFGNITEHVTTMSSNEIYLYSRKHIVHRRKKF